MGEIRRDLTWSVRDFGESALESDRLLQDLGQLCRRICQTEFTEADGYTVVATRLSGAVEGASVVVTRQGFRALVSVQRFYRHDVTGGLATEVRVVAAARHRPWAPLVRAERRFSHVGAVAGVAGLTGVGVAAFSLLGVLSTWGQLMALMPALMVWRMTMALRIAGQLRQDAMQLALAETTSEREHAGAHNADLARWQRVIDGVAAQRDAVIERLSARGFRTAGALPGTVASLAPPPIDPVPPGRTLPLPNLALPPLGRPTGL